MGHPFEDIIEYWRRTKEEHPEYGEGGVLSIVVGKGLDRWEITVRKCTAEEAFKYDALDDAEDQNRRRGKTFN